MHHMEGLHCTYNIGSDRYPGTLIKISRKKTVLHVQLDKFEAGTGHDYYGSQKWIITRNPDGDVLKFVWSDLAGTYRHHGTGCLTLGNWEAYQDPYF